MQGVLRRRRVPIGERSHLELEPDPARPDRYLVRFCGLDRDPAARSATEGARVKLMLANLRGEAPFPHPLPARIAIGWLDRHGWRPGRSPLAAALAEMPAVREAMQELDSDLMLRVALVAAAAPSSDAHP
jgi:hypothetical protein